MLGFIVHRVYLHVPSKSAHPDVSRLRGRVRSQQIRMWNLQLLIRGAMIPGTCNSAVRPYSESSLALMPGLYCAAQC